MNFMQDKQFLLKLDQQKNRIVYVRLIALDKDEFPIESIEGRATGGSISLDGNSSVTRTCSLSLVGQDLHIHDYFWAMRNKFKAEIGVENHIDSKYDDIIWFKQGIFYITSFSLSESTNNFSISISGKDKMSKLDGSLGGTLTTQVDFGTYDQINADGAIVNIKNPIRNIITQAIQQYAQEPVGKIIINDLPDYGFELWNYRGLGEADEPLNLYYFYSVKYNNNEYRVDGLKFMALSNNFTSNLSEYEQLIDNDNNEDWKDGFKYTGASRSLDRITEADLYYPSLPLNGQKPKGYAYNKKMYFISRVGYGQNAGYHRTDLVYPGELIANAGETIAAAVLTKIANVLGDFEFFYDLDGNFVFQKKKTYITGLFSPITENQVMDFVTASQYSYEFRDAELVTAYSNQPQISEVKNDFTIWGTRKSVNGNEVPIHSRYAIAHKPKQYKCMNHFSFCPFVYIKNLGATYEEGAIKVANIGPYKKDEYVRFVVAEDQSAAGIYIKPSYYKIDSTYIPYYMEENLYIPLNSRLNTKYKDKYLYVKNNNCFEQTEYHTNNLPSIFKEDTEINLPLNLVDNATYYYIDRSEGTNYNDTEYDWRELIYIMAEDYYQHHEEADFSIKLRELNPDLVNGMTGYEVFYTDILGFWRQLYNPHAFSKTEYETAASASTLKEVSTEENSLALNDNKTQQLYLNGIRAYTYDDIQEKESRFNVSQRTAFRESLYKKCWSPTEIDTETGKITKKGYWYLTSIAGEMESGDTAGLADLTDLKFDIRKQAETMSFSSGIETIKTVYMNDQNKHNFVLYQINLTDAPWSLKEYLDKEAQCYNGYYYDYDNEEYSKDYLEQTSNVQRGEEQETTDSLTSSFYALQEDFTYIVRTYEKQEDEEGNTTTIPVNTTYSVVPVQEKSEEFISDENNIYRYWSKTAVYYPEDLIFWFDFLDTQGDLEKFSIENIGNRNKVDNNNQVGALFYREAPLAEFVVYGEQSAAEKSTNQAIIPDYIKLQINSANKELFTISSQGLSAAQRADELIYQNACIAESINITCIPIYYLQPNTRIYVYSENSKINGDYIVSKITLPLTYNGTMSISATKVMNLLS